MPDHSTKLSEINVNTPTVARMYDAALGGKDHFEVDRQALVSMEEEVPGLLDLAISNRGYLTRAVDYVSSVLGLDQFLDLGSGLPAADNTHEIAQRRNPGARVLYVDIDPIVLAHGRALLADNVSTDVITADLRDVGVVFASTQAQELLDVSRPVCVMAVSILHCIPDESDPFGVLRSYMERLPSGSALIYSHIVSDDVDAQHWLTSKLVDDLQVPWGRVRTSEEAEAAVEGLEVVPPVAGDSGRLVECSTWNTGVDPVVDARHNSGPWWEHAAVAVKP